MSDHPSTYEGTPTGKAGHINWDDRAALHRKGEGDGVLDGATALQRGTFAEMIRHLMLYPEDERDQYTIEKLGDREFSAGEAAALYDDPAFPAKDAGE